MIPLQQQPHIIQPQMVMQQQPQMLQQPRKLILQAQIVPQHQQAVQVQALQEVQPQPQRHDEVVFNFILFVTSNHQTTNLVSPIFSTFFSQF